MEQRKEQKKEQRVYAAFGRGARRDWKRAARKTVFSHYWMAIMVCLVAAFLGTEFTGSLESLHFTRQKWDVISNFLASFGRPGAAAGSHRSAGQAGRNAAGQSCCPDGRGRGLRPT